MKLKIGISKLAKCIAIKRVKNGARILSLVATACGLLTVSSLPVRAQEETTTSVSIQVKTEKGLPAIGAKVMIGEAPNSPFPGNVVATDEMGIAIFPTAWRTALPVTVSSAGYVKKTFPSVAPENATLVITQEDLRVPHPITGDTRDYGRLRKDGLVDFSIVFPTIPLSQIPFFDPSWVISPETDTLQVAGRSFELPSNLSLPNQVERYVFDINLNKPQYRVFLKKQGPAQLIAAKGQFPMEQVVDQIRDGQSIFNLMNYFNFQSAGGLEVLGTQGQANQNISITKIPFDRTWQVQAPTYPRTLSLLTLLLNEYQGNYYPSDLKFIPSGSQLALKSANRNGNRYIMSLYRPNEGTNMNWGQVSSEFDKAWSQEIDLLGSILRGASETVDTSFMPLSLVLSFESVRRLPSPLPLIPEPRLTGGTIMMSPPAPFGDIVPGGTLVVLSEIQFIQRGTLILEKKYRLWEGQSQVWTQQMSIPRDFQNLPRGRNYRWDVIYFGKSAAAAPELEITHVTRNKIDVQL